MPVELLAPAKDLETGLAAINCGADAVYIGASRFGAREAAGNSTTDIDQLIAYAHRYWARVYVVVNTLLYNSEIPEALKLINQVYQSGADALIIQDLGLLECDLPPIPLFASTQMHNHTPERVAFLEKVGFQRAILARELSLEQIREIRSATSLELETFIHGALCVSYSGQCYLSYAIGGRSGNRGQCAQPCRNRYSLADGSGKTLIANKHLLSIRDLNQTIHLQELLEAGVTSFKIEGRLKDINYVKNVVGHYRTALDQLQVKKSSSGTINLGFEPDPNKTFNRGYCDYFISGSRQKIGSNETPKMIGEPLGPIAEVKGKSFRLTNHMELHNGDGLSFFNANGELDGTLVNRVDGDWITPAKMDSLRTDLELFRNHDKTFLDQLEHANPERKIALEMTLSETSNGYRLSVKDEDGIRASFEIDTSHQNAEKAEQAMATIEKQLRKLGETDFTCQRLTNQIDPAPFMPVSALNDLRRGAVEQISLARKNGRPRNIIHISPNDAPCPVIKIDYLGNALNEKAITFYQRHGVTAIESAAENGINLRGRKVMTTKYCLKYQLGACPHLKNTQGLQEPLTLVDESGHHLALHFDCRACQMEVWFE